MTHRSQELMADLGKLLIRCRVHSAAVTMVTMLPLPPKPRWALAEFRSLKQRQGGLASVLQELWRPGEQRRWKTAWGDAMGLYRPVGGGRRVSAPGQLLSWEEERMNINLK